MKFLNIKESDMENRDPESYWKLVLFKIFSLMGLLFFTLQTIGTPVESMSQHIIRATIASLLISVFLFVRKDSHLKYGALLFFTPIALVSIAIPFLHVYGMNSPILNNYVSIILASYLLLGRKFGIIFYLGLTLPLLMHYFDVFRFFGIGQHLAYTPEIKASLIARTVVHTSVLMVMATVEKIHLELRNDISSRSIKEQKKESELVLTRVASGFAHEINNPLAIIDGYLNMIRLYNSEGKKISTDAFRNIESSIVRINGVVEKFLAIFSQGEPKKEICLLESVIKSSLELEGFENSFIYDFDPHVEILSERRSLTQILNLISKNAFEAVNSDEHIIDKTKAVLKWSVTGPNQLTCIDSGPGFNKISFEDAAKPFVTTNFETSGRGLGLFTVLYICEKLNIKLTYKRLLGRTHICLTFDEPFSISEKSTTKKSA